MQRIDSLSPTSRTALECGTAVAITSLFLSSCSIPSLVLITAGVITAVAAAISSSSTLHRLSRIINRTAVASIICTATIHPLIHEGGHAMLASLLYKSPGIKIALNGFTASTTYSTHGGLTWLGSLFGADWAPIMVAAGGFLASLAWGVLATQPILIYSGMARLLSEAHYALTALRIAGWNQAHDYQYLWIYGNITPIAPAAILLGAFTLRVIEAMSC